MNKRMWLCLSLVLFFFLLACRAEPAGPPTLQVQVGECDESRDALETPDRVRIGVRDGQIHVVQDISYVCCADIVLELEQEGDLLKIIETNQGEVCRCMCGYHVEAQIGNLPDGRYRVQVWGVQYEDVHPLELLGQAELQVGRPVPPPTSKSG